MKSLDRKMVRDLFHTRGLIVAITSVIAVGVMCFVTLRSSYENLSSAQLRYYRQCQMADFWVDLKKVPLAEIDRISSLPGIKRVDARIQFSVTVDLEDSVEPTNGLVISLPDRRRPVLNDVVLKRGTYFSQRRENEVIINESFAEAHSIHPGQEIRLLLNNRRQSLVVVGTATSSEFSYLLGPGALLPDPKSFGVFYLKRSYAEEVYDFSGAANQIVGQTTLRSESELETLLANIESQLDSYGVTTTYPRSQQSSHQFLDNEILGLRSFATVMPTIFLFVAALILNVFVTRLVRQQRTMIGTIKALGFDDVTIFVHFLKMGCLVGLLGSIVGCVFGYLLSMGMTGVYEQYFEFPDLRSDLHWRTFAISIVASLLCAMIGSFFGARNAVRMQPAEAMRPAPPRSGGPIFLERFSKFWASLSPNWRLTLRSTVRSPIKTSMTVISTMLGAGLLLAGFNLYASQDFLIDFQFYRVSRSDIDLAFQEPIDEQSLSEISRLPGVDFAEPVFELACTLEHLQVRRKIAIQGIRADSQLTVPRNRAGDRISIPPTGLVLDRRLAKSLGVGVGDSVTVIPSIGTRRPKVVEVARVVDSFIGLAAYAEIEFTSSLVEEAGVVSKVQLLTNRNPNDEQRLYRRLKEMPQIMAIVDRRDLVDSIQQTLFQNQLVMIVAIVSFAGVIFFGSIANAAMVSLSERAREVATLRAIGYGPWGIGGVFLRESFLTAMIGTILGLPAGVGFVGLMAVGFETDLVRLPVVISIPGMLISIVLAILFVLLSHLVVQRAIHRQNILDALNIKE